MSDSADGFMIPAPAQRQPRHLSAFGAAGVKGARAVWILLAMAGILLLLAGQSAYVRLFQGILNETGIETPTLVGLALAANWLVALVHISLSALILWRVPRDAIALLVAFALLSNGFALPLINVYGELDIPAPVVNLLLRSIVFLGLFTGTLLLFLFPDGRFVLRGSAVLLTWWGLVAFTTIFFADSAFGLASWPAPLQLTILALWTATGLLAQRARYRHTSDPIQKQQVRWASLGLLAAALAPLVYLLPFVILPAVETVALPNQLVNRMGPSLFVVPLAAQIVGRMMLRLLTLAFPLSLAVAVLRYRLWDIDILINRTLVYGALTLIVLLIYAVVVGGLALLFQMQVGYGMATVATAVVALLALPLRQRLQRDVNRLMYGERDDPLQVLSKLGAGLEAAGVAEDMLPTLARTVAQSLRLPYVAVFLKRNLDEEIAAAYGKPVAGLVSYPLHYQGEAVGVLAVAPRQPGESFSPADERLLRDIAHQAGAAAYTVRLTADLLRSRQRLVTAREEERRRLRRDLHDGLGPQLATLTLKLDAARNQLAHDPRTTDALLLQLKTDAQTALADIRRLVYGLRPPALDQLGLVPALRAYAQQNTGDGLAIDVIGPDEPFALPAAVEVAAYRIVTEALTNCVRHAQTSRCLIRLAAGQELTLEISDNGRGLPANYQAGVGLASMRERAEELGGDFHIESGPDGGTLIRARLPLSLPDKNE